MDMTLKTSNKVFIPLKNSNRQKLSLKDSAGLYFVVLMLLLLYVVSKLKLIK